MFVCNKLNKCGYMPRAARLYSQGTLRLASKIRLEISDILIQEHGG
jgi:hypothetical protein